MSGNVVDARVKRTRGTLGDALVTLMQEKPFESVTVQDLLDRAGVSRSTFYAHYTDKQDLFLSDVEDFFEMMSEMLTRRGAARERIVPVRELFAHVAEVERFVEAMAEAGKAQDVRELGVGYFARSIEERLVRAGVVMEPGELKVVSTAHAGALFTLLDWWIARGRKETPEAMDGMFHRMVWRGVGVG